MIDVVVVFSIPEDHEGDEPAGTVVHRLEIEGTPTQFLEALDLANEMSIDAIDRQEAAPGTLFRIVHDEQLVGKE